MRQLSRSEDSRSCLDVAHLDDSASPAQRDDTVQLLMHAAPHYINSPRKAPPFRAAIFYKPALMVLDTLCSVYGTTARQQALSFHAHLKTAILISPILAQNFQEKFFSLLRMIKQNQRSGIWTPGL